MKIEVNSYRREDGLYLLRISGAENRWAIRRVGSGPTWFYRIPGQHGDNPGGWIISSSPDFELNRFGYPFEIAMETFKTVSKDA